MTDQEKNYARHIRAQYQPKTQTKADTLRALDRKVNLPALVFAYVFGSIGALVLGFGMCLAMNVLPSLIADFTVAMIVGVAIGVVGIVMVSVNYFIYLKILTTRKQKYADEINRVCDEILQD